jgi:hypothetical protein
VTNTNGLDLDFVKRQKGKYYLLGSGRYSIMARKQNNVD